MNPREALLEAIGANRLELAPRLIYADYLDEVGETDRAELIRLQCELSANPEMPFPTRLDRMMRAETIITRHIRKWHCSDHPPTDFDSSNEHDFYHPQTETIPPFRNGFLDTAWLGQVSGVTMHFPNPGRDPFPNAMMRRFPFSRLGLKGLPAWDAYANLEQFPDGWGDYPDLVFMGMFQMTESHIDDLQRFMPVDRLRRLEFQYCSMDAAARNRLAPWLSESTVESLRLDNLDADASLIDSIERPIFSRLTKLQMRAGQLNELTLRRMIESGISHRLTHLHCLSVQISGSALRLLADGKHFPNLQTLELFNCRLNSDDIRLLTRRGSFPQLQRLNLTRNQIRDQGFHHLILFGHWPHLRDLQVGECGLTEEAFRPLNLADFAENLESLDLFGTSSTPAAVTTAMLRGIAAAGLSNLAKLSIHADSGIEGCLAPFLSRIPSLQSLEIVWQRPKEFWKATLFDGLTLPNLRHLAVNSDFSLEWLQILPPVSQLPRLDWLEFDRGISDRESEQFCQLFGRPALTLSSDRLGICLRE